ncbi:uncharacterized protein [Phaseolus vulgaris]|uniref:uncharacterized protein isoform X3 n=1 Tax=Phaseolus vulgaris TaxID=3885 RepID=UPI0035CAAD9F
MGSILLNPSQPSFSDTLLAPLKNHKVHHHASASRNHRFKCNSISRTSSFHYRSSASVPLHEFPSASFNEYIEDKGRVIRSIFSESASQQLNKTRVEFPDLNGDYMPPHFNMNAKGVLYLEKKGMHNWMKNHLDVNFNLDFPPLLDWVPHLVLQTILQSVLKNYVDDINNGSAVRLLADYNLFKRKKPKNLV